jgi:hypothetical protein
LSIERHYQISCVAQNQGLERAFLRLLPQCADQPANRRNRAEVRGSDASFRYHQVKLGLDREYEVDHVHGRETSLTQVIFGIDGTLDRPRREQSLYDSAHSVYGGMTRAIGHGAAINPRDQRW